MQYLSLFRLVVALLVVVGTYLGPDTEVMLWLDAVATLKDVSEGVVWVLGKRRVQRWEARAGEHVWALRVVAFLAMLTAAYFGRHSAVKTWLAHVASLKDASESLAWSSSSERLRRWGDRFVVQVTLRYVSFQYPLRLLTTEVNPPPERRSSGR